MIRWGLCCQFLDVPIKFRSATHRYVSTLTPKARREYLGAIARDNAGALVAAVHHCRALGIGAFRINSQVLPLARGVDRLSGRARERLALENDDRMFAPADLLPLCERQGIPFVYDVHHHRCNGDGLSERAVTTRAVASWGGRQPHFHISSPRAGWQGGDPRPHADYIDPADVPKPWVTMDLTVDVEAKAKERAVVALMAQLSARAPRRRAAAG